MPDIIPVHFNISEKADGYGSKTTLLILPVFATLVYIVLTWLNKHPHLFNYMSKITEGNAEQQYIMATRVLRFVKVSVSLILILLSLFNYSAAKGVTTGLEAWFLPVALVLIFLPFIFSFFNGKRENKN